MYSGVLPSCGKQPFSTHEGAALLEDTYCFGLQAGLCREQQGHNRFIAICAGKKKGRPSLLEGRYELTRLLRLNSKNSTL